MVMLLSHEHRFQVMMEEWRQCESGIRGLDAISFKIKAWFVTLIAGLIVATTRFDVDVSCFMIFGLGLAFYFIDTMVNSYKYVFIVRIQELSDILKKAYPSNNTQINLYQSPLYPDKFKKRLYMQYAKKISVEFENWSFYALITFLLFFGCVLNLRVYWSISRKFGIIYRTIWIRF